MYKRNTFGDIKNIESEISVTRYLIDEIHFCVDYVSLVVLM